MKHLSGLPLKKIVNGIFAIVELPEYISSAQKIYFKHLQISCYFKSRDCEAFLYKSNKIVWHNEITRVIQINFWAFWTFPLFSPLFSSRIYFPLVQKSWISKWFLWICVLHKSGTLTYTRKKKTRLGICLKFKSHFFHFYNLRHTALTHFCTSLVTKSKYISSSNQGQMTSKIREDLCPTLIPSITYELTVQTDIHRTSNNI